LLGDGKDGKLHPDTLSALGIEGGMDELSSNVDKAMKVEEKEMAKFHDALKDSSNIFAEADSGTIKSLEAVADRMDRSSSNMSGDEFLSHISKTIEEAGLSPE
jgi:hypothetical protein